MKPVPGNKPEAGSWRDRVKWLVLAAYVLATAYYLIPGLRGKDRALSTLLSLVAAAAGIYLTVLLFRLTHSRLRGIDKRFFLKNGLRLARNTLAVLLVELPFFSVKLKLVLFGGPDSAKTRMEMLMLMLVMGGSLTLFGIIFDVMRWTYEIAGAKQPRPAPPPQEHPPTVDFGSRVKSWLALLAVYAFVIFSVCVSYGSGEKMQGGLVMLYMAIAFGFMVFTYRALYRQAVRLYRTRKGLGCALHLVRPLICGLIVMLPALLSEHPFLDYWKDGDALFMALSRSVGLGAVFEFFAWPIRSERRKKLDARASAQAMGASKRVPAARPQTARAVQEKPMPMKEWEAMQKTRGEELARIAARIAEEQSRDQAQARVEAAQGGASKTTKASPTLPEGEKTLADTDQGVPRAPLVTEKLVLSDASEWSEPARNAGSWASVERWQPADVAEKPDRRSAEEAVVTQKTRSDDLTSEPATPTEPADMGEPQGTACEEEQTGNVRPAATSTRPTAPGQAADERAADERVPDDAPMERERLRAWLRNAAEQLEPRGAALGTLCGQRALFEEAEALLPVLDTLRTFPPVARFLYDGLADEDALPDRVNGLLGGICSMIEAADLEMISLLWLECDPETLVRGWRALDVYRRISAAQLLFDGALDMIEAHMLERDDVLMWLQGHSGEVAI